MAHILTGRLTPEVGIALRGTGSALPVRVMTNAEFEKTLDTTDEWIMTRTGIRGRHIAGPGETTASLAIEASRRALLAANMSPQEIDLIVCATVTPEMPFPSTACFVQAGLGCRMIGAFDVSAACSGFLYSLVIGSQFIHTGAYRTVLVIGAETLTRITDYSDRSSCILFGDGAGAAVLSATDDPQHGIRYFRLYADGSKPELLYMPGGGSRFPASARTVAEGMHFIKLNGREVYRFAVTRMTELIEEAMADCRLTVDDVAMVVPHQVNQRIIDAATKNLNFPPEKVMSNLDRLGNTSAASVPIALDEAVRTGRVKSGDTIVLVAFGGGFAWASAVLTL